jgi:putative ABC transport system permease protein
VQLPLLSGRLLEERDDENAPAVVVANEATVRRYFPGTDPIGKQIRFWGTARTIVGVVADEKFMGLRDDAAPAIYPPLRQTPTWTGTLLVRSTGDPAALAPLLRQAVAAVDPDLALYDVRTMRETVDASVAQPRFTAVLLVSFAALALTLALAGVHGVLSWLVAQRTHEIGVRVALGAEPGAVVRQLTGHGLGLAAVGLVIGVGGALATARLLRSLLFGLTAVDPSTYALVVVGVLAVAGVASWLPARRAAAVDPVIALRTD